MLSKWTLHRFVFFPPADLHRPVFRKSFQMSSAHLSLEAPCIHRYPGPYEVGVVCERHIDNPVPVEGSVRFAVTFEDSSGSQRSHFVGENRRIGRVRWSGPSLNGFGLARYEVPENVPEMEPLLCRFEFEDLEGALAHYRPAHAYSKNIFRP